MPRSTTHVNGPEYQNILRARDMFQRYGASYKNMLWAENTLARLERLPRYAYTDQDRDDFLKIKEIYAAIAAKAQGETAQNHTTSQYIWRTRSDGKVRREHAANNGKIFSWNNPPQTGHPGEAFGCRCWAEAYREAQEESREFSNQVVTYAAPDAFPAWTREDFFHHYFFGKGQAVTLDQIGHLQDIINVCKNSQPGGSGRWNHF